MYEIKAKPGEQDGVMFRSRLEREWNKKLNQWFPRMVDYLDDPWRDFTIVGNKITWSVEIKPKGELYLSAAIDRVPEGETLIIIQGEPSLSPCMHSYRYGSQHEDHDDELIDFVNDVAIGRFHSDLFRDLCQMHHSPEYFELISDMGAGNGL